MVQIRFDGSGDSGQIEEMEARDAKGVSLPITDMPLEMLVLHWGEEVPLIRDAAVGSGPGKYGLSIAGFSPSGLGK